MQSVMWNEAVKINGADPDFHRRDLWNAINSGNFPEWELGVQLFDQDFADKFEFDILDATKLIPEEEVPIKKIGRLVLNRCVDNFFAETEQVAFCTQNIVKGIDFSNDPLLQGRNFSYLDTQLKRLGSPNFTHLSINAPKCPFSLFQQDGHMAMHNPIGRANYEPNSWGNDGGPRENPKTGFRSYRAMEEGEKTRSRSDTFSDHYSQARQFYMSQTDIEQRHIAEALIFELSKVEKISIREKLVAHLLNIDKSLAENVAHGLGLEKEPTPAISAKPTNFKLKKSPALSILANAPQTFEGRKLGILITDGANADLFHQLNKEAKKINADIEIIAPKIGGVQLSDGSWQIAGQKIEGGPSVLYDAVAILVSESEIKKMVKNFCARDFISDAFFHRKFIAYVTDALPLLRKAGIDDDLDAGCLLLEKKSDVNQFLEMCKSLRFWNRKF